jgi:hypothetical protein
MKKGKEKNTLSGELEKLKKEVSDILVLPDLKKTRKPFAPGDETSLRVRLLETRILQLQIRLNSLQ